MAKSALVLRLPQVIVNIGTTVPFTTKVGYNMMLLQLNNILFYRSPYDN